jgi:hypothetical protein
MAYTTNDVVRIKLHWLDSRTSSKYLNIMHYRLSAGSVSNEQTNADGVGAAWDAATITQRMCEAMLNVITMPGMTIQKVLPTLGIEYDCAPFEGDIPQGALTPPTYNTPPQMSWHFVRKTFVPGRKCIGHFYLPGASLSYSTAGGLLNVSTGGTVLQAVADALGDPFTVGAATFKPMVVGWPKATPTNPDPGPPSYNADNDVRKCSYSTAPVFHKLRRAGVGE